MAGEVVSGGMAREELIGMVREVLRERDSEMLIGNAIEVLIVTIA